MRERPKILTIISVKENITLLKNLFTIVVNFNDKCNTCVIKRKETRYGYI